MTSNTADYGPRIVLEDPEIRDLAQQVLDTVKLSILKGVSHAIDAQQYPLPDRQESVESATFNYIKQKTPDQQELVKNNVQHLLETLPVTIGNLYGSLEKVNLHSNVAVIDQVHDLNLSDPVMVTPEHLYRLELAGNIVRLQQVQRDTPDFGLVPDIGHRPFLNIRREVIANVEPSSGEMVELGSRPMRTFPAQNAVYADPILQKYEELGAAGGLLGEPKGEQRLCPDGRGKYQHFQGGSIYWAPETGAHEIHGAILEKWKNMGWETCVLGYPATDEMTTPDGKGRYTHFQGGSIYWTPETGAREIHGAIRAKWSQLQWEKGYLGYPITDECKTPDTIGRYSHFQGGSIYWTPELGAHAVHEKIKEHWSAQNWENGYLGYPITDTTVTPNSMSCKFQGGEIVWNADKGVQVLTPLTKLQFRIHRVQCLDETNPEWPGDDEISMRGVAVSLNNKSTFKVDAFMVSEEFDDGEQVVYDPPKEFYTFDLKSISGWPKNFVVTMVLAEMDCGGFSDYLRTMLAEVRDEVINLVTKKVGDVTGAALGSILGALGTKIGGILGAIAGWIIGELMSWLDSIFEDDPFPGLPVSLTLPSVWHRWSGYTDSPDYSMWTQDHGGQYQVWFDWALMA